MDIENGLKQGDTLSPLFNFALEYAIMKVQETRLELDMNGTHQVLAYADKTNSMAYGLGGSMPHSQGLSNNSYPEPNQPNYPH